MIFQQSQSKRLAKKSGKTDKELVDSSNMVNRFFSDYAQVQNKNDKTDYLNSNQGTSAQIQKNAIKTSLFKSQKQLQAQHQKEKVEKAKMLFTKISGQNKSVSRAINKSPQTQLTKEQTSDKINKARSQQQKLNVNESAGINTLINKLKAEAREKDKQTNKNSAGNQSNINQPTVTDQKGEDTGIKVGQKVILRIKKPNTEQTHQVNSNTTQVLAKEVTINPQSGNIQPVMVNQVNNNNFINNAGLNAISVQQSHINNAPQQAIPFLNQQINISSQVPINTQHSIDKNKFPIQAVHQKPTQNGPTKQLFTKIDLSKIELHLNKINYTSLIQQHLGLIQKDNNFITEWQRNAYQTFNLLNSLNIHQNSMSQIISLVTFNYQPDVVRQCMGKSLFQIIQLGGFIFQSIQDDSKIMKHYKTYQVYNQSDIKFDLPLFLHFIQIFRHRDQNKADQIEQQQKILRCALDDYSQKHINLMDIPIHKILSMNNESKEVLWSSLRNYEGIDQIYHRVIKDTEKMTLQRQLQQDRQRKKEETSKQSKIKVKTVDRIRIVLCKTCDILEQAQFNKDNTNPKRPRLKEKAVLARDLRNNCERQMQKMTEMRLQSLQRMNGLLNKLLKR